MEQVDVTAAIHILQQHHYKITKQRQALLVYLAQHADFYIALAAVDQHLRQQFPTMSYDTIYRNVKEMQSIGIVETQVFKNGLRVKYQCDFSGPEHSHFICQNCGRVKEIGFPDFNSIKDQLQHYQVTAYQVEVWGICENCLK